MVVYRYLQEQYALEALQKRRWKIGRILELNDPLDCRPVIYQNGSPLDPSEPLPPALRKAYESLGIICYSGSVEDPVIWTHYGDKHAGIALGFEYTSYAPHEVSYPKDNKRFRIDVDDLPPAYLSPKAGLEEKLGEAFLRKAHSWKYEQEFRHFILLCGCKMEGAHYFRDLPMENLRHVVIGLNTKCSALDIKQLLCPADSDPRIHFTEVQIFKAKIDPVVYRVVLDLVSFDGFELD
jgi:hypothetical protein